MEAVAEPRMMKGVLPLLVSIEGNIGCGKTTVIKKLAELFKDHPHVAVLPEPVDEWISNGFLDDMYNGRVDPSSFQQMVLMSLAGDLLHKLHERDYVLIITERSAKGNYHTFGKANLEEGSAGERLYRFTYERVIGGFPPSMKQTFVFLKASTATVKERMATRGREEEKDVPSAYLDRLGQLHDEWLNQESDVTTVYVDNMSKDETFHHIKSHLSITLNNYKNHEPSLTKEQKEAVSNAIAALL